MANVFVPRWLRRAGSIRGFLAIGVFVVLAVLSVLDVAIEYPAATRALDIGRDRALVRVAAGFVRSLRTQDADTTAIPVSVYREELGAGEPPVLRFRISDERGGLIGGDERLQPPRRLDAVLQPAVYDATLGTEPWRVAAVRDYLLLRAQATPVIVQVAEPQVARDIAHAQVLRELLLKAIARLALALAALWIVSMAALRPLQRLSHDVLTRRPRDLTPLAPARSAELQPLVQKLNELLSEQQDAINQQRKFLADASHQLRTPIAVLRTQLQGVLAGHTSASQTLPDMLRTIDRATRLTNQLLSKAKIEQLVRRGDWIDVDLDKVAREMVLEFAPLVARKRLDFSLQSASLVLKTDAWMLGELVRNLVANAIHHSPKNAALGIVVRELGQEAELIVWDHGGGVEEDMRVRLFEPFEAAKGGTGIGLGLSICKQIADSMGATIGLFNRVEAGTVVGVDAVVRWPSRETEEADPDEPQEGVPAVAAGWVAHGRA
jgi:two-component system sensor histidine kinase TctE